MVMIYHKHSPLHLDELSVYTSLIARGAKWDASWDDQLA